MLSISTVLFIIAVGVGIWFWQSSARAKELAITASKNACNKRSVQFLDGTTIFQKLSFKRNSRGRVSFVRHYNFEYFDGEFRFSGHVVIFENRVVDVAIDNVTSKTAINQNLFTAANDKNNVIPFPQPSNQQDLRPQE